MLLLLAFFIVVLFHILCSGLIFFSYCFPNVLTKVILPALPRNTKENNGCNIFFLDQSLLCVNREQGSRLL